MLWLLEQMRIALSLAILAIATIQDLKDREIDDLLWLTGIFLGGLLDIHKLIADRPSLTTFIQYLRFSIPFLIVLIASWRLRLMGEADILALITVAILQPYHPAGKCLFPPAFCTMLYSNVLILLVPMSFLLWNVSLALKGERIFEGFEESKPRKVIASLIAIAIKAKKAEKFKYFAIAQKGSSPRKKFKLISALSIPETKEEIPKSEEVLIWICPSIPMLPFILAGFVLTIWIGDPMLLLISFIR